MSHSDIIIIVATLSFASTFGVYVAIIKIKQYTRRPMNLLNREHGDIELGDITEPVYPQQIYDPREFDFSIPQSHNYERISNYPPSYETGVIPSYHSGTIPSYHTYDRLMINSCLENCVNLDFILIIFILIFFLILLWKIWRLKFN